jgi:hypothetical protein
LTLRTTQATRSTASALEPIPSDAGVGGIGIDKKWTAGGGYTSFSLSGADADKVMDGGMPGFYFGVNYDYAFSTIDGLTVEPGLYFMHYGKDRTMAFTVDPWSDFKVNRNTFYVGIGFTF